MHPAMILCQVTLVFLFLCFLVILTAGSHDDSTHFTGDVSINCASKGNSVAHNGREWIGDVQPKLSTLLQLKGLSDSSTVIHKLTSADPVPYKTARISDSRFSYAFRVSPGQKIIRLHFNPSSYKGFKMFRDLFTVEAGPFTLLSNFSASLAAEALGVSLISKEFCMSIEENQTLSISFSPVSSQLADITYAFINGIEIISVPMHLSYFRGTDHLPQVVGQKSQVYIDNSTALEFIHRQNVKQDSILQKDELDDKLGRWGAFPKPKENESSWRTPVDVGFRYLVRIYFHDLRYQTAEIGSVIFKVLINEMIVDTNTDIVKEQNDHMILWYRDYIVAMKGQKEEGKQDLLISLQSYDEFMNIHKFIKGFQIFKLSNHDNSLASPNALPHIREPPSWVIQKLQPVLFHGNATATVAISILVLINIIVHKLREIWEESNMEEENRQTARTGCLCRRFSLAEIQLATKNFREALVIGNGGFGKVYKGLIDNGRQTVAVKRLKPNSKQGKQEFLTEIGILSELRHINLVSLIGYCNDHREMILVYEHMPNGTLADHFCKPARDGNNSSSLTWKQRLNICIGAGRGLDYLHTGNGVIHRDVKASNILLDENLIAKVSDFGLAKPEDRSRLQTHVSTKVKGTFGYFDPYYFITSKLTRKSDTYAFGVVLLEVLCGRQATDHRFGDDEYSLTRWALNKINEGEIEQIVDSCLEGEIAPDSLKVFVAVAQRCLHGEPKKRPTMAQVVVQLELALEQQESRKLAVVNDGSVSYVSTEQSTEAFTDVQIVTSPPAERKDSIKLKKYKPLLFSAWDAFWNRVKPSKKKETTSESVIYEADIKLPKFDLTSLAVATNQFSSSHKIREGGFCSLYKAVLPTGKIVAVKKFSLSRRALNEFKSELLLVSSLRHRSIIKLLGYCIHEHGRALLYEFMENRSLDKFIFDELRSHQLQWPTRFKIIIGVAEGIIYLHQDSGLKTIHRDLKPSNILLDIEMNPRISGFGNARSFENDQSELDTTIAGTFGYISPEYVAKGRISEKIDAYSFGVIIMETLSGKKNMGYPRYDLNLIDYAWKMWNEGKALNLVDEALKGTFSEEEAVRCIQVGLLCTQYGLRHRPTMPCVLKMLLGEEPSLQEKIVEAASRDVSINCGSTGASAARNGRQWFGDVRPKLTPLLQLGGLSAASTAISQFSSADPVPHKTARISQSQFSYAFQLNPGKALDLVDEAVKGTFSEEEAMRCIQVGFLCTQYELRHRPTMPCVQGRM
ncbi:hypothetical protein C2S52_002410 [Perilla frutescens var. hirtella]|nr:hypothetical protein C2S52_002410 [Perilla frutescens var. hirtella]